MWYPAGKWRCGIFLPDSVGQGYGYQFLPPLFVSYQQGLAQELMFPYMGGGKADKALGSKAVFPPGGIPNPQGFQFGKIPGGYLNNLAAHLPGFPAAASRQG